MARILCISVIVLFCSASLLGQDGSDSLSPQISTNPDDVTVDTAAFPTDNANVNVAAPQRTAIDVPDPEDKLSARFIKYKNEHNPDEVFFNVLKIVNNSDLTYSFTPKFVLPFGWNFVGNATGPERITLQPGEKKYIPVRISSPKVLAGGLAYVVSGELVDDGGNMIIPVAYSYLYIPRLSNWKLQSDQRQFYVSENELFKSIKFRLENKGNSEENIKIKMEFGLRVSLLGVKDNVVEMGVVLPPYTDSTITLNVQYKPQKDEIPSMRDNRIAITARSEELGTSEKITLWFEEVRSVHKTEVNESTSPLIVWGNLFNLLTDDGGISLQMGVRGTVLFNYNREFGYYINSGNIFNRSTTSSTSVGRNYFNYTRFRFTWKTPTYMVVVGDVNNLVWGIPLTGRGITGHYKLGKSHYLQAGATVNIFNPIYGFGISDSYQITSTFHTTYGLGYRINNLVGMNNLVPVFGGNYRLGKHNMTAFFAPSYTNFKNGKTDYGYSHLLNYSSLLLGKLNFNASNQYSDNNYFNVGKFINTSVGASYPVTKRSAVSVLYNQFYNIPTRFDSAFNEIKMPGRSNHSAQGSYSFSIKRVALNIGPGYQRYSQFNEGGILNYFSNNYTMFGGVSVKNREVQGSLSANASLGYSDIHEFDEFGVEKSLPGFLSTAIRINGRMKNAGVMFTYFIGAPSYTTQQLFDVNGRGQKAIRLNPYYQGKVLNDKLMINANLSYWYQINGNTSRTTFYSYLDYDLGKGWSINGNILFYASTQSNGEGDLSKYRDFNLNAGFRKLFDFPQPRVKNYDLKLILFKDLNGNRQKDENEVGIPAVLVKISRIRDSTQTRSSDIMDINLMTDQFGEVSCIRIPESEFEISTLELDGGSEYINQLGQQFKVNLDKNLTIYIPFTKSNKIYGKVVIHRAEYSSKGMVDVNNIRVTAMDSLGNQFSGLSDSYGNFVIFAPHSGLYTISIKNPFGQDFVLEKKEYQVDFNGLKEFKVTFVFKEQARKINFKGNMDDFKFGNGNNGDDTKNDVGGANGGNIGSFDDPQSIAKPIDPSDFKYKVQVGAFNTKVSNPIVDQLRKLEGVEESSTPEGLTRFTLGNFKTIAEAEDYRKELINGGIQNDPRFIVVIGDYKGKVFTADEVRILLQSE